MDGHHPKLSPLDLPNHLILPFLIMVQYLELFSLEATEQTVSFCRKNTCGPSHDGIDNV